MFITQNNQNSNENANLVVVQDNEVVTTSLKVAEVFEKEHAHVLRDIQNIFKELEKMGEDGLSIFGLSSYINAQNKNMPMYVLNEEAFTLLAMGYKGSKAFRFRRNYIKAFNEMRKYIDKVKNQSITPVNEKPFFPSVEAEKILKIVTLLQQENEVFKIELEKQKQFTEGLRQRISLTEDTLDKRPPSGLSFPDIPTRDFFVYFAFNPSNGLTKIGRSKLPASRVWNFQAVEPGLTLTLLINTNSQATSVALEQLFHKLFANKNHQRELFMLNEYDMNVSMMLKNDIELVN